MRGNDLAIALQQLLASSCGLGYVRAMNRVVHFEIPADNMDRAQQFYSSAFGWTTSSPPGLQYALVHTTETDKQGKPQTPGAINGGILPRKAPLNGPVITVDVGNIDEAIGRVQKAGGQVVHPKFQVGSFGISAYIKDTEGNVIGLWQCLPK